MLIAEEALTHAAISSLNEFLSSQEAWSDIPLVVMTGSGETSHSSQHLLRAFSKSGNVTLLERPFRAITLISTLQVALRARKRQYQVRELLKFQVQATRTRDEFISIASHELKTPITSLKLQAQMSKRLVQANNPVAFSPERVTKQIETTDRQLDRLARLVEDMLDVSRINSGKLAMAPTSFDLRELVTELVDRLEPQLAAAGCQVTVDAPEPVLGTWDHYRIEQVINNLMTNAIRYSPSKPIHIQVVRDRDTARILVQDRGAGIALENQERIFERFERAVGSTHISGLGLGLYICRQIIDAHQGTIRVQSEPGQGSTFIVELPFERLSANSA